MSLSAVTSHRVTLDTVYTPRTPGQTSEYLSKQCKRRLFDQVCIICHSNTSRVGNDVKRTIELILYKLTRVSLKALPEEWRMSHLFHCLSYIELNRTFYFRSFVVFCISKGPHFQDLVVESIVSLTSSIVVKMLSVLVSTISHRYFCWKKNVSSFCKFFQQKY